MDAEPKLLDRLRAKIRTKHYSYRTEQQYVAWVRRFILFHDKKHPTEPSAAAVEAFLTHLAVNREVTASTQNQALAAILFLYRDLLEVDLPWIENIVRARASVRMPVVLPPSEVAKLLGELEGQFHLIGQLLYGSGLRLMEALRLRLKDIDFEYSQILVRDGKGSKDRVTILPNAAVAALRLRLRVVREQHRLALSRGFGGVELPAALARKYPNATRDLGWQYVFPASRPSRDPRSGAVRRHHHRVLRRSAVRYSRLRTLAFVRRRAGLELLTTRSGTMTERRRRVSRCRLRRFRGADLTAHDEICEQELIGEQVVVGSVSRANVTNCGVKPVATDAVHNRLLLPCPLPRGGDGTCFVGRQPQEFPLACERRPKAFVGSPVFFLGSGQLGGRTSQFSVRSSKFEVGTLLLPHTVRGIAIDAS